MGLVKHERQAPFVFDVETLLEFEKRCFNEWRDVDPATTYPADLLEGIGSVVQPESEPCSKPGGWDAAGLMLEGHDLRN